MAGQVVNRKEGLGQVLEDSLNEIFIFDAETLKFTMVNRGARNNLGYSWNELSKMSPVDIKPEFDDKAFSELVEPLRLGRTEKMQFSTTHQRKDKTQYSVDVYLQLSHLDDRPVFVAIILDVTERKRIEEERRELEERYYKSQKMEAIGRLAGGIAHDFNNILQGVIMSVERLESHLPEGSDASRFVDKASRFIRRGSDLVRQIMSFARNTELPPEVIEVASELDLVLELVRATASKNVQLDIFVDVGEAKIMASPVHMQQLVLNLGTNAIEAIGDNQGAVEISVTNRSFKQEDLSWSRKLSAGNYLKLVVKDTGTGIGPDIQDRIFDPFFSTRKGSGGTGMGLSVVQSVVNTLSGDLKFETKQGEGTIFDVYIPTIEASEVEGVQAKPETAPGPEQGSETILVVDDEEDLAQLSKETLERKGYKVLVANNGQEGLEVFKKHSDEIGLIITDQMMPKMSGLELTEKAKAINPALPVILATGFSDVDRPDAYEEAGISALLYKPFRRKEMTSLIRKLLDQASS